MQLKNKQLKVEIRIILSLIFIGLVIKSIHFALKVIEHFPIIVKIALLTLQGRLFLKYSYFS